MKLPNHLYGEWREGLGEGQPLHDPVTGEELARVSSKGMDVSSGLQFARAQGGAALGQLTYGQRADLLAKIAETLAANSDEYLRISLLNSGATKADASFDVDGALFTVKHYAKIGRALGDGKILREGGLIPLSKSDAFAGQHFLVPTKGTAIFINAFNFPAWGFCEKAAPALLSGVPVVVKPATATAWLTHRMVADIVNAGILPRGAISILCGSARDLLEHVSEGDIVSFTGSADTAAQIRSHSGVLRRSVRVNIEADSINSAILGPDAAPGTPVFDLLVKEVVREMTLKAGQKCTAIRRVLVPRHVENAVGEAITARLKTAKVGNPRNPEVSVGPVVNKSQQSSCLQGLRQLKTECLILSGGEDNFQPIDADPERSSFVQPTLLRSNKGLDAKFVHDLEVFGPAATVIAYETVEDCVALARRGLGSLVASVFSNDAGFVQNVVLGIGDLHGRVLVADSTVGGQHTGHGNVMPSCLHGGPGRAGGGEELGGLRALLLYHRRFVMQGPPSRIAELAEGSADAGVLVS